jgi:ribonuclease P protein component
MAWPAGPQPSQRHPPIAPPAMRFRPEQHLRRQSDIRAARERGSRLDCRAFTVWCRRREPAGAETPFLTTAVQPRAGFVASRAAVGGAIQRNRAKRRLREIFRRHQQRLPLDCDLLFIARAAVIQRPFAELEAKFIEACGRIAPLQKNG